MFRGNARAIVFVLILYAICGTLDFADQVEREQAAGSVIVAKN